MPSPKPKPVIAYNSGISAILRIYIPLDEPPIPLISHPFIFFTRVHACSCSTKLVTAFLAYLYLITYQGSYSLCPQV
jgi:hypothetical protein